MKIDTHTRHAIQHTFHCLIGCGIGEVTGMTIAALLGWGSVGRISLAVFLAFCFGYGLTYFGVRKQTATSGEAIRITLATDTISITTMEIVDNAVEFMIPNALMVQVTSPIFWSSLAISLAIAFVVTVPVNRYMMKRQSHGHHMHHHM
ncbi:DUF4396 domain-containing protein [Candidatus Saccharibacteria bacterium]|nr:DUF4396 domain-containing protein [Candidatus Saccharibacteria bacterium]